MPNFFIFFFPTCKTALITDLQQLQRRSDYGVA